MGLSAPPSRRPAREGQRDSHTVSLDEQLRPLFEQVLLDPDKEVPDVPWGGGTERTAVNPVTPDPGPCLRHKEAPVGLRGQLQPELPRPLASRAPKVRK